LLFLIPATGIRSPPWLVMAALSSAD
jgi:hypothetical protein